MNGLLTNSNAWGLTGGIGSGKSIAAAVLRRLGVPVLDMDRLAADLMVPGTEVYDGIVAEFGRDVLLADGRLDRRALAGIVFADTRRLRMLEGIVHPATIRETLRRLDGDTLRTTPIVFVESAIVFEAGMDEWLKGVVVVTAPVEARIRRVMARDNASASDVAARIAAQLEDARRIELADAVWTNAEDVDALRAQIIDTLCVRNRGMRSIEH